jgi:PAS domain S-box-containing protein
MAAVALYARRGVNAHAVALFRVFLSMLSLFALCNAMEISASSLALKVTFRSLRVLVDRPLVPFPLALTLAYLGRPLRRRSFLYMLVIPCISVLLTIKDPYRLFLYDFYIGPAETLLFSRGPWFFVEFPYILIMWLTPCVLLLLSLRAPGLRASNTLMLACGLAAPILTEALFQLRLTAVPGYRWAGLSTALFVWGLLRGNAFAIVPVARHLVLESMGDLVIVLDAQGRVVDSNRAAEAACPVLRNHSATFPQDWKDLFCRDRGEVHQNHLDSIPLSTPTGQRFYDVTISPIQGAPQQPLGLLLVLRDVTEPRQAEQARRLAEERLRQSEEHYRLISDNSGDVIWTLDLTSNRLTYVSPSVFRLRGLTPSEALAQPLEAAITAESMQRIARGLPEHLARFNPGDPSTAIKTDEIEQVCKDGTIVATEVVMTLIADAQGKPTGILGVSRDITERKRIEAECEKAQEAAEAANRAKSEFLANMSHELRTPMSGVLGMTSIFLDTSPLSSTQRQFATTIKKSGEALLAILNDILDFSKIEAGRLEIESVTFNVRVVVDDILRLLGFRAEEKGLGLRCVVDHHVAKWLSGDPTRLRQVLTNLLGNAIKFTAHGEVVLGVHCVESDSTQQTLRFDVQDTGIGIAPETLATLFRPFAQGDSSIARRFGGTGLGLAISKQLVELIGGTFHVRSELGVGSVFSFTASFPQVVEGQPESTKEKPDHPGAFLGARILLAEDNKTNQEVALIMLTYLGCDVQVVANGIGALNALASADFDLVLMDVQMPELDGFEATRRLRERCATGVRVPVIALTAHAMRGVREQCLEAGMDDYLCKPIDRGELARCLGQWLRLGEGGS